MCVSYVMGVQGPVIRENPISVESQGDDESWLFYVLEMIKWNRLAIYEAAVSASG